MHFQKILRQDVQCWALQDMGRTVPGDVSLMGYDGIAMARYCVPRLATICQDTGRMARRGGRCCSTAFTASGPPPTSWFLFS